MFVKFAKKNRKNNHSHKYKNSPNSVINLYYVATNVTLNLQITVL